ncbi:phosphatase PAP2 family protein [Mesonia sp. K7]|uniref:phosphatase PAP2 family protein n=1 Tax=Mesonia sp. K7 TaxID=2218606 RepID=UPI000DA7AD9E|nr:phosphatase PAP2 family protein [Mesonia sp. K7]PZD78685.1 PA-phosphatase [Mesonia sp. K7]
MKYFLILLAGILVINTVNAQQQINTTSPYKTEFWTDAGIITGTVGLNVLGFYFIQNKDGKSLEEVNMLSEDDVWAVDRWVAGNYSEEADRISYIPFYSSFALPLTFLAGDETRENMGQISVLYVESMATAGALYTLSAGLIDRDRPLVYNRNVTNEERMESSAQRSFFAGHGAATAAATFFTAKVFHDYYPDSPLRPYVWGVAFAIPAYVGYLRIEAGKHFLTDTVLGLGVGAAAGILIPELHKKENTNLSFYPTYQQNLNGSGFDAKGVALSYRF